MPRWDNNELDDQPIWDASMDFRGGMNSVVQPHLLTTGQYAKGFNMLLTNTGRLRTRGGLTAKVATAGDATTGLSYYEFFDGPTHKELVLFATDDGSTQTLKTWDGTSSASVTGYDLEGRVSSFQGMMLAFFFAENGAQVYDGNASSGQSPASAGLHDLNYIGGDVTVTAAGTGYVIGDVLTLTKSGATYQAGAYLTVTAVGGSGEITGVGFSANGDRGCGWSAVPDGFTGGTGSSATFDYSGLSLTPPPALSNVAVWHTERVIMADKDNPDDLVASDIRLPQYFDSGNRLQIGSDGEPITGLHSWDNSNLLVFKTNSVYMVSTTTVGMSGWTIQKVSDIVGCVSHWTTCQVGSDVWWLSREGIQSVRRLIQETQREITNSISAPVHNYISTINWQHADKAALGYWDNKVFFAFPTGNAVGNDAWLVYDTYHSAWVSEWCDTAPPNLMVRTKFNNESELYVGTEAGGLRLYEDALETDADITPTSSQITSYVEGRACQFGDPVSSKDGLNMELEFKDSTADVDIGIWFDYMTNHTPIELAMPTYSNLLTIHTTPSLSFTLPAVLSDNPAYRRALSLLHHRGFQTAQPRIYSSSKRISLRQLNLSAFLRNMRVTY